MSTKPREDHNALGVPEIPQMPSCGGELAMEPAVAVGEKPSADCNRHAAEDEKFVAHDQGGQDHERYAAESYCGAGGDVAVVASFKGGLVSRWSCIYKNARH